MNYFLGAELIVGEHFKITGLIKSFSYFEFLGWFRVLLYLFMLSIIGEIFYSACFGIAFEF